MELVYEIFSYVLDALGMAFKQIFVMLGPAIVLGFIQHYVSDNIRTRTHKRLGWEKYCNYISFLGTSVHELGHAFFCVVFRHKIHEVKLFAPDPETKVLGYVKASPRNPNSRYQKIGYFFIGVGPLISGPVMIYFTARYLLGEQIFGSLAALPEASGEVGFVSYLSGTSSSIFHSFTGVCSALFTAENFTNWRFYLFVYVAFAVGHSMKLSAPDIKGARKGFVYLIMTLFTINLFSSWLFDDLLTELLGVFTSFYSIAYPIMLLALTSSILFGIVSLIALKLKDGSAFSIKLVWKQFVNQIKSRIKSVTKRLFKALFKRA